MRRLPGTGLLALALILAAPGAVAGGLEVRVRDELGWSAQRQAALLADLQPWSRRVYAYLGDPPPRPVNLILTRRIPVGYYARPNLYLPPADAGEMLETWVHELAHHVTGHDSSFFFKEGIATHVLEAVFAGHGRMPQGFPQYGRDNDAWVALYARRGELPPLAGLMALRGYDGRTPESDFRSWQVYVIGGSFVGWLIRNEGLPTFFEVFDRASLGDRAAEWERRWRAEVLAAGHADFDPMDHLPDRPRYRRYAARLGF